LNHKWFLDFIQNNYFSLFILKHSYETCYKIIDKGILEILIFNTFSFSLLKSSRYLIIFQNGYIYAILCFLVICLILFLNLIFFCF
jgi:hypothetical protein